MGERMVIMESSVLFICSIHGVVTFSLQTGESTRFLPNRCTKSRELSIGGGISAMTIYPCRLAVQKCFCSTSMCVAEKTMGVTLRKHYSKGK